MLSLIHAIGYVQTFYEFQTDICCIKKNAPKTKNPRIYLGYKSCSFMFTHKLRALTCVIEIFLLNEFSKGDQDLTINVKKSAENLF